MDGKLRALVSCYEERVKPHGDDFASKVFENLFDEQPHLRDTLGQVTDRCMQVCISSSTVIIVIKRSLSDTVTSACDGGSCDMM